MKSLKLILNGVLLIVVFTFSALMLNTITQYLSFDTNVGFLRFKQAVIHHKFWLFFFYVHIFSVIVCLLAGLTQFSRHIIIDYPKIHRLLGKIYVYTILIINFPACFVLAIFSNGGIVGIFGFVVQDIIWGLSTINAIIAIRRKKINLHRNWMIVSYSITTTAITFRIIKNLFYREDVFTYQLFYGINVWLSMLINLSIALIIIKYTSTKLSFKSYGIDKYNNRNT